jgi:hypothetical protein
MPMVFDVEDLKQYLNCFEEADTLSPMGEPFVHFPMLANYVSQDLNEKIDANRYRFDDIINVIYHGNCMYPFPIRQDSPAPAVSRYGFKNENHVWAWPEYWKSIERNVDSSNGKFRFVDVEPQKYYFDYVKKEHRFVTDEGQHTLTFIPPTGESSEDGAGNSQGAVYPSISIDGKYPRYFKIIYDDYNDEQVDWMDESTTGEAGSSGGDGSADSRIYEKANNGPNQGVDNGAVKQPNWIHDFNTIFDSNAEDKTNEDRKAFVGVDLYEGIIYGYYNRGLIAYILKNRLYYLPIQTTAAGEPTYYSSGDGTSIACVWTVQQYGIGPTIVEVMGQWGVDNLGEGVEVTYSKPALSLSVSKNEVVPGSDGLPDTSSEKLIVSVTSKPAVDNLTGNLDAYDLKLDPLRTPDIFTTTWDHITLVINAYTGDELKVTNVSAQTGRYVQAQETIKVWERRYNVGVVDSFPDGARNADGPDSGTFRTYQQDREDSGQYFPMSEDTGAVAGAGKTASKLTYVGYTEVVKNDESISITMDNLKDEEITAQKELYNEAYDKDGFDILSFTGIVPPALDGLAKQLKFHIEKAQSMKLTHLKATWDYNSIRLMLNQKGSFWQPGGHYFAWTASFFRTRCYIFGPIQNVYEVGWVHYKHGGTEATLGAGESYEGWGRLAYYEGKLRNMGLTGQTQAYQTTDALTGAKNGVTTESR